MIEVAGVVARLGFKVDDDGANRFERKVRGLREDARKPVVAQLKGDLQPRELDLYSKKLDEIQARTRRKDAFKAQLGADFDPRAFNAYEREVAKAERRTRSMREESTGLGKVLRDTDAPVARFARNLRGVFETTAKIGSLGLAAQGISAVGAAGGAAAAGLAPLGGALAAYPALASAAAQGIGVFKLATSNILEAVGGLNENLDENTKAFRALSPAAQDVARQVDKLKRPIIGLSETAQKSLFPPLVKGIREARRNFGVLEDGVGRTARVLGDLGGQAGKLLGSRGFGRDLDLQMRRNDATIRRTGEGGLNLANALRHVVIAAGPLVEWMTRLGVRFTELIERQAKAGRESGALGRFFEQTRLQMDRMVRIAADLGAAFINIGKAAYPVGSGILRSLTLNAEKFKDWTDSAKGENAIRGYFERARPAIDEAGRLIRDLIRAFFRLGSGDQVAPLLRTVRRELLPAIEQLVDSTTKNFMPAFLRMATEAIKLFTHLGGSSGPLVAFAELMGRILRGVNRLLDRFPLLNDAVVTLVAAGGLYKALGLAAALTGVRSLIGLLTKARTVAATAGIVSAASGGAGRAAAGGAAAGAAGGAAGGPAGIAVAAAGALLIGGQSNLSSRDQRAAAALARFAKQLGDAARSSTKDYERLRDVIDKVKRGLALTTDENDLWTKSLHKAGIEGKTSVDKLLDAWSGLRRDSEKTRRRVTTDWGQIDDATKESRRQFRLMRINTKDDLGDIVDVVRRNTIRIKDDLGTKTREGKEALADNFSKAIHEIRVQMRRGTISTRTGMEDIRHYLVQELRVYGLSLRQAREYADRRASGTPERNELGNPFKARGGWIGARGMVSGDVVPVASNAIAAFGEYDAQGPGGRRAILTRHQAPLIELGLAMGGYPGLDQLPSGGQLPIIERATRMFGGLDRIFSMVTRPHFMARGGIVGAVGAANQLERAHFPYVWGGGHQATPAPFGPMDCSGAVSYVLQNAGVNIPTMTSGQLAQAGKSGPGALTVFANARHTLMRIGSRFFGTSESNPGGGAGWMSPPPSSYLSQFAVRHFMGGDDFGVNVKTPRVIGGGLVGAGVQRVLRLAAAAASRFGTSAVSKMGVGTGNENNPALGGIGRGQWADLWTQHGGAAALARTMAAIVMAESSGDARADNGIARGPYQFTRPTWADFGRGPWSNAFNPGRATDAAINVVRREGRRGLNRWDTFRNGAFRQYLNRGGFVGRAVQFFNGGGHVRGVPAANRNYPNVQDFTIKAAQRRVAHRIGEYEDAMGSVETHRNWYAVAERKYNRVDEGELLDEKTGKLNVALMREKARHLFDMIFHAGRIRDYLEEARKVAQRVVANYTRIIKALRESLKHAKKKDRSGIHAQIADASSGRDEYQGIVDDLRFDVINARMDVEDLGKEYLTLTSMTDRPPEAPDTGTDTGGGTGPDQDAQAIADQATRRAEALAQDLAAVRSTLRAFTSTGDIGSGGGTSALGSTLIDAAGGIGGAVAAGVPGGFIGGGVTVVINQDSLLPGSYSDSLRAADAVTSALGVRPVRPVTQATVG